MSDLTAHGGGAPKKTKRVFLRTGTAYTGYAMCYNWDAVGVDAENVALSTAYGRATLTTIGQWSDARRVMVEVPTHLNSQHFAGVVDAASNGVVGPNWIEVNVPGSVCDIHTVAVVSLGAIASQNEYRVLTFQMSTAAAGTQHASTGKYYYTGFSGEGAALCLAEASTADTLVKAELLTGRPSGGVLAACTADSTVSAASSSFNINVGGWTHISVAGGLHADVLLQLKDGVYDGERIGLEWTATTDKWALVSGIAVSLNSLLAANSDFKAPYRKYATLSASADYIVLEWHGADWWVTACNAAINSA